MAQLIELLPSADALLALEAEDLAIILLRLVQAERGGNFAPSNYEVPLWNANTPGYPHHKRMPVARAFAEAWQWLISEGLLITAPDQPNGFYCITRKGERLKTAADFEAYRQGNMLPLALLHSKLAEKVRPMFVRGDYDVAVFQAFKEVEVAVRAAGGYPNDLVGVPLMRKALHPEDGPLTDTSAVLAEREALGHLFAGAMGHCKNPPSHRNVSIERVSAAQLIVLASNLLTAVDSIVARRNSPPA